MRNIPIGRLGMAFLFWNEASPGRFDAIRVDQQSRSVSPSGKSGSRALALEVYVPLGAKYDYGLLGASYERLQTRELDIRVHIGVANGASCQSSISSLTDTRVGLPAEYGGSVIASAIQATPNDCPGILTFDRAVHSLIGSSPALFAKLSTVIVQLLFADETAFDALVLNAFEPPS